MRIISANVNGIRSAQRPDLLNKFSVATRTAVIAVPPPPASVRG